MALIQNLVHQQATGLGTGNMTLVAFNGRQTFNQAFGIGPKFYYAISNQSASEWEVGLGHLSGATTLVRDTVIKSSNANALVSFGAGTKDITNDVPAEHQNYRELLQSNLTLYVRADGNDANDGLSNTPSGAFLTVGAADTALGLIDANNHNVTVQVGPGTFGASVLHAPPNVRYGYFRPYGLSTIFSGQQPIAFMGNWGLGMYLYGGMYLSTPSNGKYAMRIGNGAAVHIQNGFNLTAYMTGSFSGFRVYAPYSFLRIQSGVNLLLKHNTTSIFRVERGARANVLPTITTGGSVACSVAFAQVAYNSYLRWHLGAGSNVGSITGRKFKVGLGCAINTYGAFNLPGNVAGYGYNGGVYE